MAMTVTESVEVNFQASLSDEQTDEDVLLVITDEASYFFRIVDDEGSKLLLDWSKLGKSVWHRLASELETISIRNGKDPESLQLELARSNPLSESGHIIVIGKPLYVYYAMGLSGRTFALDRGLVTHVMKLNINP